METLQKLREKVEKGKALVGRTTTETVVIVGDFMPYSIFAILERFDGRLFVMLGHSEAKERE